MITFKDTFRVYDIRNTKHKQTSVNYNKKETKKTFDLKSTTVYLCDQQIWGPFHKTSLLNKPGSFQYV